MSSLLESPPAAPVSLDPGHPCALDCLHASALRTDPFGEEWLWCAHPANSTRLVHPGPACPRYRPRDQHRNPLPLAF